MAAPAVRRGDNGIIMKSSDSFPRTQHSHVPRNVSASALASSQFITRKQRRTLNNSRELVVQVPRTEPTTEQDKFCRKLKALPLAKLLRRAKQCYARHSKANRLLEKLSPNSKFRSALEQEAIRQVYLLSWVRDEVAARRAKCVRPAKEEWKHPFEFTPADIASVIAFVGKQAATESIQP